MKYATILFMLISCAFLPMVAAETIIVGEGGEAQVYDPVTNTTTNLTQTNLTLPQQLEAVLKQFQATSAELDYLKAINERNEGLERKYNRIVDSLERTTEDQLTVITEQKDTIQELNSEVLNVRDTLGSRINELEDQTTNQTYILYILIPISMLVAVLIYEWTDSLTRRKKLYFKLRNFRDNFPINLGILTGGREK